MFFCFLTNFLFQILWVLRLTYKTYMEQKCTLKTGMLWNYDRIKSVQNNWQDDVHIFQFWSIYNVLNNFVCIFDFKNFTSLKLKQAAFDLQHSRKRLISRMSQQKLFHLLWANTWPRCRPRRCRRCTRGRESNPDLDTATEPRPSMLKNEFFFNIELTWHL